jgi:C4-dicarboxylate-specific signal transduction histidine kinase
MPGQIERLLPSVAANQVSIGLQEARGMSEEKRIAAELDRRVAERTVEPATANAELRKEIVERESAGQKLLQEEGSGIPVYTIVARAALLRLDS